MPDTDLTHIFPANNYTNKFNQNYREYYKKEDDFMNAGEIWDCVYISGTLRFLWNQNSKIAYRNAPKANTFAYYGIQVRYNTGEISKPPEGNEALRFRETYRFTPVFGRQLESKNGRFLFDAMVGISITGNYNLKALGYSPLISARLG